jgi:antitoxin (DNA-binding transcriptional repressor) of toxin-antitoxin stability system
MKVSAQYAEEHFADILHAADNGEEVEIARPDMPALFLAPRESPSKTVPRRPRRELIGSWEGMVQAPSQEEWDKIHQQFLDEMPDFSPVGGERA